MTHTVPEQSPTNVPRGLAGVRAKEKHTYEYLKESAEKSELFGQRAKAVAARTVWKQNTLYGNRRGT